MTNEYLMQMIPGHMNMLAKIFCLVQLTATLASVVSMSEATYHILQDPA